MGDVEIEYLRPQKGFQEKVLACKADVAVIGGSAGAGKTGALLIESLRFVDKEFSEEQGVDASKWRVTIFRRVLKQVKNQGGLWDSAKDFFGVLHPSIRPSMVDGKYECRFPSGANVKFDHLNRVADTEQYQGAEIAMIGFDELTHFTSEQFWYMLSRNRSLCGADPYMRATCNPQGYGWVKDLISWWLYPDDYEDESLASYPIPEREGVIRYMTRFNGTVYWGDSKEEVIQSIPEYAREKYKPELIKSFTFIPGKLEDNKILDEGQPGYRGSLMALHEKEQEQLLLGRWIELSKHDMRLYNVRELRDMFTNTFVKGGRKYLTCDIAMEGSDLFVVGYWNGWRLEKIYTYEKSMGDEIVNIIKGIAKEHGVPRRNIAFDCDGVGNFLKGYLRTSFDFRGNAAPIEVKGKKMNYKNLRAQVYYELANNIKDYDIFIDVGGNRLVEDSIVEELKAHLKAEKKADLKLRVIPKFEVAAEIHRSPDLADMIAMRKVFDFLPRGGRDVVSG